MMTMKICESGQGRIGIQGYLILVRLDMTIHISVGGMPFLTGINLYAASIVNLTAMHYESRIDVY